jgi:Rrf2 family protein
MKPSTSTKYAILAVGHVAQNADKGLVLAQTIAEHYDMPLEYMVKVMQQLVKANILRSKRGPRGGYSLAMPLSRIAMLDVIQAVEGTMTVSLALEQHGRKDRFAAKATKAYDKVIAQTRSMFKKVKMSDLV